MDWDNVQMIRNAQASAQARFDAEHIATQETIEKAMQSQAFHDLAVPRMTELESMIFKMRSELIDYIVAHGLVDGLIFNGVLQPVKGGKVIITKEMIETITEQLGYYKTEDVERFLKEYLPANYYVSDEHYVHTDNNYTSEEKDKLAEIEDGAEVNKIINLIFNGVSVLDDGTRIATINITPEDIKQWYESNANTNAFTDKEQAKLAGISDGAEVNKVDNVIVNGRSVLDENKRAIITKEIVKEAYEANDDTNAFTDEEKTELNQLFTERLKLATIRVNELQDIQGSDPDIQPGVYPIAVTFNVVTEDANGAKRTFNGVNIFGTGNIDSGCYISTLTTLSGNYKAAASTILVGAMLTDEANQFMLTLVFDSSKEPGYVPVTVTCSDFVVSVNEAVNAISVDSEKQLPAHGIVNLDLASKYIPYTGATDEVNLGDHGIQTANAKIGGFTIVGDTIIFDNGNNTQTCISVGGNAFSFKFVDESGERTFATVKVGTPLSNDDATTKKYVDDAIGKCVPYTGANNTVDLNGHDLVGIGKIWSYSPSVFTQSLTLRSNFDITSSGARMVALQEGGIRFENGLSTALQNIYVGAPSEDTHAATKKYVDEAVTGAGGGGALVECEAGEEDIRIITLTAKGTCQFTAYSTGITINSDGTVGATDASASKSFTLYAGHQIIFVRSATNSSGTATFRSVHPVSGSGIYLQYTRGSADSSWKAQYGGVLGANTETITLVGGAATASLSVDGLSGHYTSKYYKFA